MKRILTLLWIIPSTVIIMAGTLLFIAALFIIKLASRVFLSKGSKYAG